MSMSKDNKGGNGYNRIAIGLASPEEILEIGRAHV